MNRFPWLLLTGMIIAIVIFVGAYFLFTKPKAAPAALLFDKLFPRGSGIRELEKIDLDIDAVLQNPIFRTLQEKGPVPILIPTLGKPNPFL